MIGAELARLLEEIRAFPRDGQERFDRVVGVLVSHPRMTYALMVSMEQSLQRWGKSGFPVVNQLGEPAVAIRRGRIFQIVYDSGVIEEIDGQGHAVPAMYALFLALEK